MKGLLPNFNRKTLLSFTLLLVSTLTAWAQAPTFTSVPTNGATNVNQSADIVITFSEPMQRIAGNTTLDDTNIDALITLKLTNAAGADIPFDATIDGTKSIVTINPNSNLPSQAVIYVNITGVEAISDDDDLVPAPFTFTVTDYLPPQPLFLPADGATNVAVNANLVISFSENIFQTDGSPLDNAAILAGVVELKVTNDLGVAVPFTPSFNGTTQIVINPDADLSNNTTYYLELNPVEDANGNESSQIPITFSTPDNTPPVPSFNPTGGSIGVVESDNIIITFNEPIRNLDDSPITPGDLATLVELKLTNNAGASVAFSATLDGTQTIITINPTSNLLSNTLYYVEINPVEDASDNATSATNITFTTGNTLPPDLTFNPANGAVNVPVASNLSITFSEPVRKLDNSPITPADLATLIELKLTNNGGAAVPFTASINGANTIITIDPTANLSSSTLYYLEINPIEDFGDNAIVATNITFTSADILPPIPTFNPPDGTIDVIETNNIIVTFNEPVRKLDNSAITSGDLLSLVELKLTDNAGAAVPFTASIDGTNTIITIDPTSTLAGHTVYYVEINPVEDFSNNASVAANITFTTDDTLPPSFTFTPAGGSTNFSALGNIIITFNESIRNLDNSPVTAANIQAGLVVLKETNSGGPDVPFTATINGASTIITINPSSTLLHDQLYYVATNPVEDAVDNATVTASITFRTEDRPAISSFIPAAAERCIGDNVTINGSRFTGTGTPLSGNTQPTVYINGVAVASGNIVSFNANQVVFTLPNVSTGNFPITVRNNDSDLLSAGSNFDIRPAIDATVPVTPATLNPAQNTSVNVSINPSQTSNYNYSLILTAAPGGFSAPTPPATVHSSNGNNGNLTLNTANGPADPFTSIGDYTYRIDVSRTNCVTKTLSNTPFTLTVAALSLNVSATDVSVCVGSPTTLIGAVSGGTGFYQFRWTSTPPGFSSSSSSPTVSPTSNVRYNLEVEDNAGNIVTDFVDISVNPNPVADIIPAPLETTLRKEYTIENRYYQLYGSPAGGVFAGPGVTLQGDGNYYFNPQSAGVGNNHQIVYTYTNGSGCSGQDTETFKVTPSAINNLDLSYCQSIATDGSLSPIITLGNAMLNPTYQFTRLVFYYEFNTPPYYCFGEVVPVYPFCGGPNPLTISSYQVVTDIQFPFAPVLRPATYTLNLDVLRNNYGFTAPDRRFYIFIYGKNAAGVETFTTYQPFEVLKNDASPTVVGINENGNICSDLAPITLSSSEPAYTITNFTMAPGAYSGSLSGTNNSEFDPGHASLAGADERPLTITMSYNDTKNCPNSVIRKFNWVKKPDLPIAPDVAYCQVTTPTTFTISGSPSGSADKPIWYDALAPTVAIDSINWTFVAPGVSGLVPVNKTFLVQQQFKGCKGNTIPVDIEIKPAPSAVFTNTNICEDRDFTLTGPLDGAVPYDLYVWSYGDTEVDSVTTTNIQTYNYGLNSANAPYTIGLTVVNSVNCRNDFSKTILVGQNPKPNFTANLICDGDNSVFSTTTDIPVAEFSWNFGDGVTIAKGAASNPAPEGGTIKDPVHGFPGAGTYPVTVTSFTAAGCNNPITKNITILNFLTHTTASPYSMADVDGGKGFWTVEDVNGNTSWQFAQATSPMKSKLTTPGWVTNPTGNYSANEKSFLNSPCLNIAAIERPVISMDLVLNTQQNFDGAVLEYSDDGGLSWKPTGNVNSGINWFNTSGFFAGNIGNSPVGWSGDSQDLEDNPDRDSLVQTRRALDNIADLTLGERAKVRFRLAFQTNNDRELEGIAFNNVTISSRNRISLVENFTNESDPGYTSNNAAFKLIPGNETAKIQYHIGFPGADPNFQVNTVDPSARAGYYGIPYVDQYIPRGYIDGFSNGRLDQPAWIESRFNKQALKNSPYTLAVSTLPANDPNYLKVSVSVTALVNIPASRKPLLQIAVVEKTVGNNEFILRKLISSAAGRLLPPMPQSTTLIVTDSMRIENNQIDVTDLAIIAFVQDEVTKEIYQSGLDINPTNLPNPSVTTSIVDLMESIQLYPNPANEGFIVELPIKPESQLSVNLIDQLGRPVQELFFEKGEQRKSISTQNLSEGIYIVQIGTGKAGVVRKKILVVHKN